MSSRAGLRFLHTFRQAASRPAQRRAYASATDNVAAPPAQSRFTQLWNSPIGPKTVHFWAPIMKWGLVIAGAADFARPAESLSLSQNAALMATGLIWTRWCFVIKPKNLFLASVNFLVFCVATTQVTRVLLYRQSLKGGSVPAEAESAAKQEGSALKSIAKDPEAAIQKAKV
ncbi:hypothetical protein MBLNU459_g2984t2 [Dothideomycetes sp. NU459]